MSNCKFVKVKYTLDTDVSFMYPNPSAIVPMPHFKFKITANEDELLKHGYNSKHYWERSRTPEGALIAKELFTRLPTKEATQALYNEMIDKGFTHLKKVISLE